MKNYLLKFARRIAAILVAACALVGLSVRASLAQVASYSFAQSSAPYTPITGGTLLAISDLVSGPNADALDGVVHPLPNGAIPFPFVFNGTSYTGGFVASNGFLTFGSVAPHGRRDQRGITSTYYDSTYPLSSLDDTGYDGAIAAMGCFIQGRRFANPRGQIRHETIGTSPNREFILQWSNIFVFGDGTGQLNFQIRLHETSNAVELAYGSCAATRTNTVEVGLRGYSPNDFNARTGPTWPGSTASPAPATAMPLAPATVPPSGLRYTFTPTPPLPCPLPFNLVATNLTGTTATLNWRTLGNSPGPYQVVYGPAGFDPATATPQPATGQGLNVSGLSPTTDYDFYVTQACGGAAGTSPRSVRGNFRTTLINDDPVGALDLPIGVTCQPVASTLLGATPTSSTVAPGYLRYACGGTRALDVRYDVWYKFTTATSGPASTGIQLQATGGRDYFNMRVYASAGGAAGPFAPTPQCAYYTGAPGPPTVLAPLLPNTTYYVVVYTTGFALPGSLGPIGLCATVPPTCSAPTALASNLSASTATTAQLTFVPGSGATSYTVTYAPVGGGAAGTVMPPPTGSPVTITGLTPATNYTVTLTANCAATNGQSAPQTVTVGTRPANATAATAQPLPVDATCQPVPGSTFNGIFLPMGIVPSNSTSCGLSSNYQAVWYTFVTPATGPASRAVRVSVSGAAAQQVRLLSSGSGAAGPFAEVGCTGNATGGVAPPLDVAGLTPGATYYLLVGGYQNSRLAGPFTICVSYPPTCGTPQGVGISSVTGTGANLTFIGGTPPATGYTVTVTAQGSPAGTPQANTGASGQIALIGLLPGTYYTASLVADCGAGGPSLPVVVPFRTAGPPANDGCANAQTLTCTQPLRGFFDGATAAGDPAPGTLCAAATVGGPGVWYQFTGTGDDVTFSTCGSPGVGLGGAEHRLHVFSGTCGALICVGGAANDFACTGAASTYTVATTAGTGYYLFLSAAPGTVGEFLLSATCRPAGSCPPPAAPRVVPNATGTAVTVTFGAAPGASTALVYAPLGSTAPNPSIQLSFTSPVTLAGLTPGMSYVLTMNSNCGNGSRSVPVVVPFSTVLSARTAALAALAELFPNPARGTATLLLSPALRGPAATVRLYNALGQAVRAVPVPAGAAQAVLDLQGLAPGGYLLRLPTAAGVVVKRLDVE